MTGDDDRFAGLFAGREGSVLGDMRAKLVDAKARRAREAAEKPAAAPPPAGPRNRLPPGQHLAKGWPVLDLGTRPLVPTDRWKLTVVGAVDRPAMLDWRAFMDLPQVSPTNDIHCVTGWSTYDNRWHGVATATILDLVQPRKTAAFVMVHSHDGYCTNLPLARFAEPDALIVHGWNGAPLERDHGGPARLVVPSLYFWKSAKWLRQITFLENDAPGFWETRGYHTLGDPWREQRYG